MGKKIKALVVDDSAVMRQLLTAILSRDREIEVVGTAADPYFARDKIRKLQPDVLTLDVEMPRMDGLMFLEKLMRQRPMPVVMVSALTEAGCETTLRALELGAVDYVTKPRLDVAERMGEVAEKIIEKVKIAAHARLLVPQVTPPPRIQSAALPRTTDLVITVGASTGGTEALKFLLASMPADAPGFVIVQHMPELFTRGFAERLNTLSAISVKEAADGDRILPGHALIAPGDHHITMGRSGANYFVQINSDPPVNHHRPSVDVLFHSVAESAGRNAIGIILTGMGADGARGLLEMKRAGARTIAQDEESCVVFGMPKEAIALGAADQIVPLSEIAQRSLELAGEAPSSRLEHAR
jgi:two-component system chemotaxis response regulator CheB